jgi:predicted nucleic acid-binding Zn ribbon protein
MKPHLRARVIAEWRGLPEIPFPKDTSQPIGVVLSKVIADLGLSARVKEEEIQAGWKSVVGDFLAQHSSPQKLIEGVLYVRVLQPAMLYELERTWRPEIVKKLKARFGRAIRDVRFRVG